MSQLTNDMNTKQLTAEEILVMAKGNTLHLQAHKVNSYLYFDESGFVYGQDTFNNDDTGGWDVSEQGELCFKLKEWWFGKLRCFSVYNNNNKHYLFNNSGVLEFTADHMQGDVKNQFHTIKSSKKKFLIAQSRNQDTQTPSVPVSNGDTEENITLNDSSGGPSDDELKSTVKWMAKDCPGCNLANTNLSGADLVGAKLEGANLSGANLNAANLRRAKLSEANLEDADLSYANLPGADLRQSDLTNANFKGANLIRANFTDAKIDGAIFDDALLEGVEGLQQ